MDLRLNYSCGFGIDLSQFPRFIAPHVFHFAHVDLELRNSYGILLPELGGKNSKTH